MPNIKVNVTQNHTTVRITPQPQTVAKVHTGIPGKTAYKEALDNGFVGTLNQWLESLVGDSAYEIALNNGFVGTQQEWLDTLKGTYGTIDSNTIGKFLTNDGVEPFWETLTKTTVGLGNVDNTSDVNKPISTATQTALNDKVNSADLYTLTEQNVNHPAFTIDQGSL